MAEVSVDVSEDDPRCEGWLPEGCGWQDDNDIVLKLGSVEIRMTSEQAERLFEAYRNLMHTFGGSGDLEAEPPYRAPDPPRLVVDTPLPAPSSDPGRPATSPDDQRDSKSKPAK